jgi:hypothetical protein
MSVFGRNAEPNASNLMGPWFFRIDARQRQQEAPRYARVLDEAIDKCTRPAGKSQEKSEIL